MSYPLMLAFIYSQFEQNKKRDAELAKLRKLLEDVHMESEETAHTLRKKHQEAIQDLQDQLDAAIKSKAKYDLPIQSRTWRLEAKFDTSWSFFISWKGWRRRRTSSSRRSTNS